MFDDSPKSYEEITCKNYQSHPDMNFSDHLPVSGLFDIKVIDSDGRKSSWDDSSFRIVRSREELSLK